MKVRIPYVCPRQGLTSIEYDALAAKILAVGEPRAAANGGEYSSRVYRDVTVDVNRWDLLPPEEVPPNAVRGRHEFNYLEPVFRNEVLPEFCATSPQDLVGRPVFVLFDSASLNAVGLVVSLDRVVLEK